MPFFHRASVLGMKAIKSPLTGKILHGAKAVADIGSVLGIPATGAISKGLGVAEKVLENLQK